MPCLQIPSDDLVNDYQQINEAGGDSNMLGCMTRQGQKKRIKSSVNAYVIIYHSISVYRYIMHCPENQSIKNKNKNKICRLDCFFFASTAVSCLTIAKCILSQSSYVSTFYQPL